MKTPSLTKLANRCWSEIVCQKGDVTAVDRMVHEAVAAGMRDAALLVEFADLFWTDGDPRKRIASELRRRADETEEAGRTGT